MMKPNVDLQSFKAEVLQQVAAIQESAFVGIVENGSYIPLKEYDTGGTRRLIVNSMIEASPPREIDISNVEGNILVLEGYEEGDSIWQVNIIDEYSPEIVARKDIRDLLCPALKEIPNDVLSIAGIITPILVDAGAIVISLNPLIFAIIAFLIAKWGIKVYCAGYE